MIRDHALGRFGPFLQAISQDGAMLVWLDSNRNVKGAPNENYARELMELFSLGVGNYTEADIREVARAFTGWHTDGERFRFKPELHDAGPKTVFGKTGNWDGGDIVKIVLEQPAHNTSTRLTVSGSGSRAQWSTSWGLSGRSIDSIPNSTPSIGRYRRRALSRGWPRWARPCSHHPT
jgi:hypothetical protein